MDENGVPICNSVYWTDTRSVKEKQYLAENFGKEIFEVLKYIGVAYDEIGYNQPKSLPYPSENPFA